jgi:transposase
VEKGGLREALEAVGVTEGQSVPFAAELRLGWHGRTRRVLAPKGVRAVQRVQVEYAWRYLLLAVAPLSGELHWAGIERMRQEQLRPVLAEWELECVVWDGAPSHKGKQVTELKMKRVPLPPYSPELNPAERIFEEVRARLEGRVYDSLEAKQAKADAYLQELAASAERVKQLCGWHWIVNALDALPAVSG